VRSGRGGLGGRAALRACCTTRARVLGGFTLLGGLAICLGASVAAGETGAAPVVVEPVRDGRDLVAAWIGFRLGPAYESQEEQGLSEWMVRSLPLGAAGRSSGAIEEKLWRAGCRFLTDVDEAQGGLGVECSSEGFERGLDVLLDLVTAPTFPDAGVAEVRERLLEERRVVAESLRARAIAPLDASLRGRVPPDLASFALRATSEVVAIYRRFVVASNVAVAVVGALDPGRELQIRKRIESRLAGLNHVQVAPSPVRLSAPVETVRIEPLQIEAETACLAVAHRAPAREDPDEAPAAVLLEVTAGRGQSRMARALRDLRPLWLEVSYSRDANGGLILLELGVDGAAYAEARRRVEAELQQLRASEVAAEELARAKLRIRGEVLRDQQSFAGRARQRAADLLDAEQGSVEGWLRRVEAVRGEEVLRLARELLPRDVPISAVVPKEPARTRKPASGRAQHIEGASGSP
jgi:zinc protease